MPRYGYTLFSELNPGPALVRQAADAEAAGFDFLAISDHFSPWLSVHSDSPFAWSVLGAVAQVTERVDLVTMVTCPWLRYHPAIVAQAAATVADLSGGRLVLGLGAGERLNEHIVGQGWPAVDVRHEAFREAIEIIGLLFDGDTHTYRGRHLTLEDARLHSLPEQAPAIAVAVSGKQSVGVAADLADAIIAVEPDASLIDDFASRKGGRARAFGQQPIAYDVDTDSAADMAQRFKFGMTGWKVMSELPNVVNFDAAAAVTPREEVLGQVPHGSDPQGVVDALTQWVDAGYDEVCIVQCGDQRGDEFFTWWTDEVRPLLP